jgi:hypothetical protein
MMPKAALLLLLLLAAAAITACAAATTPKSTFKTVVDVKNSVVQTTKNFKNFKAGTTAVTTTLNTGVSCSTCAPDRV